MKKAVITTGGKQYLVREGEELDVGFIPDNQKANITFSPMLVIDGDKSLIGQPYLEGNKVEVTITVPEKKAEKTTSIKFEAKKRVHKVHGHRQLLSTIKVIKIN